LDEANQPVQTVAQAVEAQAALKQDRKKGKAPGPRITPPFNEYCAHYLDWHETMEAKSKPTLERERSALNHCVRHFGCIRISAITPANVAAYLLERKQEGTSARNLNLQIVALRNLFNFAKREELLKNDLPTRDLKQLPYKAAKRDLLPSETIDALCAEATRTAVDPTVELILRIQKEYPGAGQKAGATDWQKAWSAHPGWKTQLHADTDNGLQALYSRANYLANNPEATKPQPVYAQGQMLADWIRLMQYSGARRNAALHAQWQHVDWQNRQLHLFTKRNKEVIVNFNPKLEGYLKDMRRRRVRRLGSRLCFRPLRFKSGFPACLRRGQRCFCRRRASAATTSGRRSGGA
jgi:site-specific recombinase XerD